jgi:hypothetical protein
MLGKCGLALVNGNVQAGFRPMSCRFEVGGPGGVRTLDLMTASPGNTFTECHSGLYPLALNDFVQQCTPMKTPVIWGSIL